jgi:TPR repeat protein
VAQFNVGYAYQTGEGVSKDAAMAAQWYRRSAANGNMGAQFMLGFMYRTGEGVEVNYTEALKW